MVSCCEWCCPNAFVVGFATILALVNLLYPLLSFAADSCWFWLGEFLVLGLYSLAIWCWLYTATADPGRVRDDLRSRGLLDEILRGNIPPALRSLPICTLCGVPQPPLSKHCDTCGHCVLRQDHHCGVTGNCIADKTIKSFILSFFYLLLFGIANGVFGLVWFANYSTGGASVLVLIVSLYSLVLGVMVGGFGITFVSSGIRAMAASASEHKPAGRLFWHSFGKTLWERMIPLQRGTTFCAWPGVFWEDKHWLL
jgi:hypothetical protein